MPSKTVTKSRPKRGAIKRPPAKKTRSKKLNKLLITFVLDKSGSMQTCQQATISGFNEFLLEQQKSKDDVYFSLTLFDTSFEVRHVVLPVKEVPFLDYISYRPSGMTSLYDAVGNTIRAAEDKVKMIAPDKHLFVILTDGEENSSKEFTRERVKSMIEAKTLQDWEFIYLGANVDAYQSGGSLSIPVGNIAQFSSSPAGTSSAMAAVSANATAYSNGTVLRGNYFTSADSVLPVDPSSGNPPVVINSSGTYQVGSLGYVYNAGGTQSTAQIPLTYRVSKEVLNEIKTIPSCGPKVKKPKNKRKDA